MRVADEAARLSRAGPYTGHTNVKSVVLQNSCLVAQPHWSPSLHVCTAAVRTAMYTLSNTA